MDRNNAIMRLMPVAVRRSREGAWIEIDLLLWSVFGLTVAPARERGLKWILHGAKQNLLIVAPARERGLKFCG